LIKLRTDPAVVSIPGFRLQLPMAKSPNRRNHLLTAKYRVFAMNHDGTDVHAVVGALSM
jgi:hypothetical protein